MQAVLHNGAPLWSSSQFADRIFRQSNFRFFRELILRRRLRLPKMAFSFVDAKRGPSTFARSASRVAVICSRGAPSDREHPAAATPTANQTSPAARAMAASSTLARAVNRGHGAPSGNPPVASFQAPQRRVVSRAA